MGSSSSCSTLQMGASQVLSEAVGRKLGMLVSQVLTVWVPRVWADGYFILKHEWLVKVHSVIFPSNPAPLNLQGWGDGRW